jgi:20S proteasome alpha/beta subunit
LGSSKACDEPFPEEDSPDEPINDNSPWEEELPIEEPAVTIALGFVCKRGIILASDSQMSTGESFKRYDERKVFELKTSVPIVASIAVSGDLTAATYFREVLDNATEYSPISSSEMLPEIVSQAMKQTRLKLLKFVDDGASTPSQRADHLKNHLYRVILAYYHGQKPCLYTFSSINGVPRKSDLPFVAIGSGANIAGFILSGGLFRDFELSDAISLSIFTVEACKRFDRACGGDFQHYFLDKEMHGGAIEFWHTAIKQFTEASTRVRQKFQGLISKAIIDELRQMEEENRRKKLEPDEPMIIKRKDEKKSRKRNRKG